MSDKQLWDDFIYVAKERDKHLAEIERLRRFKTAYEEWIEKTEWVQAAITSSELPAKYLGWHRADIMRAEIEQLRAEIATVKEVEFPRKMEAVSNGWRNKLAAAQAEIEQMQAELARKDRLFEMLLIAADDFYGTLATYFVRDIAQQGINAPKAQEPYGCEAPKPEPK